MKKAYTEAANKAGEFERANKYAQAKLMWQAAEQYANRKFKKYCNIRAEFRSKSNQNSYRQLLDKHCIKISAICPPGFPAWQWLNVFVHRVNENKG